MFIDGADEAMAAWGALGGMTGIQALLATGAAKLAVVGGAVVVVSGGLIVAIIAMHNMTPGLPLTPNPDIPPGILVSGGCPGPSFNPGIPTFGL